MTDPIAAAVAADDPQMAEKNATAITATTGRPPRLCPTHASTIDTRRLVAPL